MTSCRFIARSTAVASQGIGTSWVTDVSTTFRPKSDISLALGSGQIMCSLHSGALRLTHGLAPASVCLAFEARSRIPSMFDPVT